MLMNPLSRSGLLKDDLDYLLIRRVDGERSPTSWIPNWFEVRAKVLILISLRGRLFHGCMLRRHSGEAAGFLG